MRAKHSYLPPISQNRSVQLFPAHLTQLATFDTDTPNLTLSKPVHLSGLGNTHAMDKSHNNWLANQRLPKAATLSNVFPSFTQISKELVLPHFLYLNMFHLTSE